MFCIIEWSKHWRQVWTFRFEADWDEIQTEGIYDSMGNRYLNRIEAENDTIFVLNFYDPNYIVYCEQPRIDCMKVANEQGQVLVLKTKRKEGLERSCIGGATLKRWNGS